MSLQIPILMYHKVGVPVNSKADTFLNVSRHDFQRQMQVLRRMGYTGVTFVDAVEGLTEGKPLPKKPVCVTFDDGYTNVRENALPMLASLHWPATVFVPTAYVGSQNTWDVENGKPVLPIMDWQDLQGLQDYGWEMAGHTHSHPHLDRLKRESALREIERGGQEIDASLGKQARTFCYPFGGLNEETPELAKQAGFIGACTTKSGLANSGRDPMLLPRVKVAYRDGVLGLLYRLIIRPRLP